MNTTISYFDISTYAWITTGGIGVASNGAAMEMSDGELPTLNREMVSDEPDQRWGRLDIYSKLGLVAATKAIRDCGFDRKKFPGQTGIFIATADSCIDADHNYYQSVIPEDGLLASPNLFAYTLPNCLAGEIALRYQITGPALIVSQYEPQMLNGLKKGLEFMQYNLCDNALAGYCNVNRVSSPVVYGCKPGAVFFVLKKIFKNKGWAFHNDIIQYREQPVDNLVSMVQYATTYLHEK